MSLKVIEPDQNDRKAMLDALEEVRDQISSGDVRALFMVTAPRDLDGVMMQWDIGAGSFAEMIGWLEQLKMRLMIRSFEIIQNNQ